ncbi:MAG: hypothetical protein P8Z68_00405 [Kineosporiaceae bacterium]
MRGVDDVHPVDEVLPARHDGRPKRHAVHVGEVWPARALLPGRDEALAIRGLSAAAGPARGASGAAGPDISLVQALLWFRWLVVGVLLGAVLLGAGGALLLRPAPTATAQIAVLDPRGNTVLRQGVTSEASFRTYTEQRAVYAVSQEVLVQVSTRLREQRLVYDPDDLRDRVTAVVSDSGAVIDITAVADSGAEAAAIADTVVAVYRDLTRADLRAQVAAQTKAVNEAIAALSRSDSGELSDEVNASAVAQTVTALQSRAAQAAVDASTAMDGTRFVVPARILPSDLRATLFRGMATGAAVGVLLTVVLGYVLAERVPAGGPRRRGTGPARLAPAGPVPDGQTSFGPTSPGSGPAAQNGQASFGPASPGSGPAAQTPEQKGRVEEESPTEERAGAEPSADGPPGEEPVGDRPAGEEPAGDGPPGEKPVGEEPVGDGPAGSAGRWW